uniref:Uncharacterized protein n=1 Tax=Arundo donax TaxID=35708 RepID=A0A0A8ZCR1_ARUDO
MLNLTFSICLPSEALVLILMVPSSSLDVCIYA